MRVFPEKRRLSRKKRYEQDVDIPTTHGVDSGMTESGFRRRIGPYFDPQPVEAIGPPLPP